MDAGEVLRGTVANKLVAARQAWLAARDDLVSVADDYKKAETKEREARDRLIANEREFDKTYGGLE